VGRGGGSALKSFDTPRKKERKTVKRRRNKGGGPGVRGQIETRGHISNESPEKGSGGRTENRVQLGYAMSICLREGKT